MFPVKQLVLILGSKPLLDQRQHRGLPDGLQAGSGVCSDRIPPAGQGTRGSTSLASRGTPEHAAFRAATRAGGVSSSCLPLGTAGCCRQGFRMGELRAVPLQLLLQPKGGWVVVIPCCLLEEEACSLRVGRARAYLYSLGSSVGREQRTLPSGPCRCHKTGLPCACVQVRDNCWVLLRL